MYISTFRSQTDAYIHKTEDLPWEMVAKKLCTHFKAYAKKDVYMYNLAQFKTLNDPTTELGRKYHYINGVKQETYDLIPNTIRRCRANVLSISGIVLDVDKNMTMEQAIEKFYGIEYVLYTTFRHTKSDHRFRITMPFSRPLLVEDIDKKKSAMMETFPEVDKASFSVGQSFYFHSGFEDNISYHNRGVMIDPYWFPDQQNLPTNNVVLTTHDNNNQYGKMSCEDVGILLDSLKKYYPELPYSERRNVTWAVNSSVSKHDTIMLMRSRWPDSKLNGKYEMFVSSHNSNKITLGTVYHMIRLYEKDFKLYTPLDILEKRLSIVQQKLRRLNDKD